MTRPALSRRPSLESLESRITPANVTINGDAGGIITADTLTLTRITSAMGDDTLHFTLNGNDLTATPGGHIDSVIVDLGDGANTLTLSTEWAFGAGVNFTGGAGTDKLISLRDVVQTATLSAARQGNLNTATGDAAVFTGLDELTVTNTFTATNTVSATSATGSSVLWNGTGGNAGSVYSVKFSGLGTLKGGSGDDTFDLGVGAGFTNIDGGNGTNVIGVVGKETGDKADKITLKTGTSSSLVFRRDGDAADTSLVIDDIGEVQIKLGLGNDELALDTTWTYGIQTDFINAAGEGTDTLTGNSGASTFTLDSVGAGTLLPTPAGTAETLSFSGVESINGGGGAGVDTLSVPSVGTTAVTSSSRPAADTIRITKNNHGISVGDAVSLSGLTGLSVTGGTFTVTAADANTFDVTSAGVTGAGGAGGSFKQLVAWSGTGLNAGSVAGVSFTNIGKLSGGAGDDAFTLESDARFTSLDASTGADSLSVSSVGTTSVTSSSVPVADTIRITKNNHGISVGDTVSLSGLTGLSVTSGTFTVTAADANTFDVTSAGVTGAGGAGGSFTQLVTWSGAGGVGRLTTGTGRAGFTDFTGVETLVGGDGGDSFLVASGAAFTSINGAGGANELDVDSAAAATLAWTLSGTNAGSVGSITAFSNVGSLQGNLGKDSFSLAAGATFSSIDGGSNDDTVTQASAMSAAVTWTGTAPNKGSVGSTSFNDVEILVGGDGDDAFTLNVGASFKSIDGKGGDNSLTVESAAASTITWADSGTGRLGSGSGRVTNTTATTTITDFTGIQTLIGGDGKDVFKATQTSAFASIDGEGGTANELDVDTGTAALTWAGTAIDAGSVGAITSFSDIQKLQGNQGNDTFNLSLGVVFEIDAGSGTNIVAILGTADADEITLKTGTATSLVYSRAGVMGDTTLTLATVSEVQVRLGLGNDTLSIADTWAYGLQANFVNAAMEGTDTLNASATASTFAITGSNAGSLKKTGGPATSVAFTGVEKANGASGAFTNTVDAGAPLMAGATLAWSGTGVNAGTVLGVDFTNAGKLQGNLADDTFDLAAGASFTEINAGSGTDVIAILGTAGADEITLKEGTSTSLKFRRTGDMADTSLTIGGIDEVQVRLGLGNDTLSIADTWAYGLQANFVNAAMEGTDTLNASATASTFAITGSNAGSLKKTGGPATSVAFTGVEKANGASGAFTNTVDAGAPLMAGATLAWSGTGVNAGTVLGVDFTNAGKLQGNLADDTFDLAAGASFTEIHAGSGNNNKVKLASAMGSQVDWYGSGPNRGGVTDQSFTAASGSITLAQIPGPASNDTLRLTSAGHTLKVGDTVILTGLDASPNSLKNATGAFVVKAVGVNGMGVATFEVDAPNAGGTYVSGGAWRKATGFSQVQKLEGTAGDDSFLLQAPSNGVIAQFASLEGGTGSDTVAALTDFGTTFTAANGFGGSIKIRASGPTTNFSSIENYEGGGGDDTFDLSALTYANFEGAAAVNYGISGNEGKDAVVYGLYLGEVLLVNFDNNTATAIRIFDSLERFTLTEDAKAQPGKIIGNSAGVDFGASNPDPDVDVGGVRVPAHWVKEPTGGLNIFFLRPGDAYNLSPNSRGSAILIYQYYGSAAEVDLSGVDGSTASGFFTKIPMPIVGIIGSPFEDRVIGPNLESTWASVSTSGAITYTIPFVGANVTGTFNLGATFATLTDYNYTALDPLAVGTIAVTFTGLNVSSKGTLEFPAATGSDTFQVGLVNVERLQGGTQADRFNLDATSGFTRADGGGGSNTLSYASTAGSSVTWSGTGGTAGTLMDGTPPNLSFDHMQNLVGGKGNDSFTLSPDSAFVDIKGAPAGEVSPGADRLSVLSKTTTAVTAAAIPAAGTLRITSVGHGLKAGDVVTLATMNGLLNAEGAFTITAADADTFDVSAPGVSGTYTGGGTYTQQINWQGTGANAGFVIGSTFSAIQSLQGNLGNDTFVLEVGSSFSSINGGSGVGTLLAKSNRGHTIRWTAGGGGGPGLGNNAGRVIRDDGMGHIDSTDFSDFNRLIGGEGDDTFVFAPGTVFTSVDGGGDAPDTTVAQKSINTLDYSNYSGQTVFVNFETAEATGLLLQSAGGSHANISKVIGSAGADQIIGKSGIDNLWTSRTPLAGDLNPLQGMPADPLPVRNDVTFTGIEDLIGGARRDVFELIGNTRFRMLDGGGFLGSDVNAILQTGTTQDDTLTLRAGGISISNATSQGTLDTLFANIQAVRLNFDAANDPTGTGGAGDDLMLVDYRGGSPAKSISANGGAGSDFLRLQAAPFGSYFYTLNAQALGVQTIGSANVDDTILYQTLETMEIHSGSGIDQFTATSLAYGADLGLVRYINSGGGQDQANLLPSTTTAFFVSGGASDPRFGQGTGLFITGITDRVDTGAIIQTPIIVSNRGYDGVYNFTNRRTISFTNIGRGVGGFFDFGGGGGLPGVLF